MALISLVYVSVESRPLSDANLKDILETARTFNPSQDITGMLLYRDGFFIQALEGEEDKVIGLYNKIRKDPRHRNVITVYKNKIEERSFSNWAMGFNKVDETDMHDLEGYEEYNDMDTFFTDEPSRAEKLLQSFRNKTYF